MLLSQAANKKQDWNILGYNNHVYKKILAFSLSLARIRKIPLALQVFPDFSKNQNCFPSFPDFL